VDGWLFIASARRIVGFDVTSELIAEGKSTHTSWSQFVGGWLFISWVIIIYFMIVIAVFWVVYILGWMVVYCCSIAICRVDIQSGLLAEKCSGKLQSRWSGRNQMVKSCVGGVYFIG